MQENVGDTAQFVQSAIALIKEIGGNPYARMLISRKVNVIEYVMDQGKSAI